MLSAAAYVKPNWRPNCDLQGDEIEAKDTICFAADGVATSMGKSLRYLFSRAVEITMKAYLITTGTVFGLITLAHIWRMFVEGSRVAGDSVFILLTILAAALCGWSLRLLKLLPRR